MLSVLSIMSTIIGILSYWPNLLLLGGLGIILFLVFVKYLKPKITFGPSEARERKRKRRKK